MNNKLITLFSLSAWFLTLTACKDDKPSTSTATENDSTILGTGYEGGIQLETQIPIDKIDGGFYPKSVPNLMLPPSKFPTFLVPEGTMLLSMGKKVTSSDKFPILGNLAYLTDGEKQSDEECFVELNEGTQWVQIDLEKSHRLYAIIVWHYHLFPRAYHDVIIQTSDDPEFKSGIATLYNNDYDNSSGFGVGKNRPYVESRFGLLVDGKGSKARYVRFYSNGSTANALNTYIEVEVFGKPE